MRTHLADKLVCTVNRRRGGVSGQPLSYRVCAACHASLRSPATVILSQYGMMSRDDEGDIGISELASLASKYLSVAGVKHAWAWPHGMRGVSINSRKNKQAVEPFARGAAYILQQRNSWDYHVQNNSPACRPL